MHWCRGTDVDADPMPDLDSTPGNPLVGFDVSWVDPDRAEYYLADRSNAGIDTLDTSRDTFKRRIGGFQGLVLTNGKVNMGLSGPNGVTPMAGGSMPVTATVRSRSSTSMPLPCLPSNRSSTLWANNGSIS
jgi:hypothetical protein